MEDYMDSHFIPTSSNEFKWLFSKARFGLNDNKYVLFPITSEWQMFLPGNRNLRNKAGVKKSKLKIKLLLLNWRKLT